MENNRLQKNDLNNGVFNDRLARIKRIVQKYSENVHLQTVLSICFTIFIILFLVHILACFFYLIGTADEDLEMSDGSVVIVQGWVNKMNDEHWEPAIPGMYV